MARTGRPPKPTEQKRKIGTLRPDRVQGSLAVVEAVERQAHEAKVSEALDRVMSMGVAWLAATDQPTLCMLRDAVEQYEELRADPRSDPRDVVAVRKSVTELLSQLGFDPTARARLGLAEVKARSKLEEIRAQRNRSSMVDKGDAG